MNFRMQWEKPLNWGLNSVIVWEYLSVSLWKNMQIPSIPNEKKHNFYKKKKLKNSSDCTIFFLIPTFPKAWIWICFFSLKNDFYCSSSSAEHTKFESLIHLQILCCICCKRYQINCIQLGGISQLFLLLKTLVKMNRQAEHSLLFLKHFKGKKIKNKNQALSLEHCFSQKIYMKNKSSGNTTMRNPKVFNTQDF